MPDYGIPEGNIPLTNDGRNGDSRFSNNIGGNSISIQDFLSNVVRREIRVILREMMASKPNYPQMKEETGRDYQWALLGKNHYSSV